MSAYPTVIGPDAKTEPTLAALLAQLDQRHQGNVCCVLLYGSCLRSGDLYDGLLDLYLICDNYRGAYQRSFLAGMNWLLPPNVFYAEQHAAAQAGHKKTLRSKVTVISLRDFQQGCSPAWFESYIWGRFAQPTHILYARNAHIKAQIQAALTEAAHTLLRNALPALPSQGTVNALWEQALRLSYATELRTERSGRAQELAHHASTFYIALTQQHSHNFDFDMTLYTEGADLCYRSAIGTAQRRKAALAWTLRRLQGKLLSVLRLVKALFTFEGGLDYIAWKLERHSGEKVVIPAKVRRAPLIYLWGFFWRLYRRGIFH